MSEAGQQTTEWGFLVGYPLDQAQQILEEEAVSYQVQFTAVPRKRRLLWGRLCYRGAELRTAGFDLRLS